MGRPHFHAFLAIVPLHYYESRTPRVEESTCLTHTLGCKPPEEVEGKKIANFQNNHFEMNKREQRGYICLGEVNTATL
jgi:hypothetical protein